jgi:O-antigen/teichoic acid export membrane protein
VASEVTGPGAVEPQAKRQPKRTGFAGNALWILLGQGAGKLASFAFLVIVARAVGAREYGYFVFAISFVPLFLAFGSWGIDVVLVGAVARERERVSELFASAFVARLTLGVLALLVSFASLPLVVHGGHALLAVLIVGCALFLDEMTTFVGNVFKAFEQMRFHALAILTNRIVSTALAILVIVSGGGLVPVAVTYFIGSLGALAFAVTVLRRRFPPIHLKDWSSDVALGLMRGGGPLAIAALLNIAIFRIDSVLLEVIRGPIAIAMYGVAFRFLESFLFVSWSLTSVALPRIARSTGRATTMSVIDATAALIVSFYALVAIMGAFSGEWMVETLFAERYERAAAAVPWLAAAGIFYGLGYLVRVAAMTFGERKRLVWVATLGLFVNVAANAVVIPHYGFVGAAVVACVTASLDAVLLLWVLRTHEVHLSLRGPLGAPVAAAAVTVAALFALRLHGAPAFFAAIALFGTSVVAAGCLTAPREMRRFAALLRVPGVHPGEPVAGGRHVG